MDRRAFLYAAHYPERRNGNDRRNAFDRRKNGSDRRRAKRATGDRRAYANSVRFKKLAHR